MRFPVPLCRRLSHRTAARASCGVSGGWNWWQGKEGEAERNATPNAALRVPKVCYLSLPMSRAESRYWVKASTDFVLGSWKEALLGSAQTGLCGSRDETRRCRLRLCRRRHHLRERANLEPGRRWSLLLSSSNASCRRCGSPKNDPAIALVRGLYSPSQS